LEAVYLEVLEAVYLEVFGSSASKLKKGIDGV